MGINKSINGPTNSDMGMLNAARVRLAKSQRIVHNTEADRAVGTNFSREAESVPAKWC